MVINSVLLVILAMWVVCLESFSQDGIDDNDLQGRISNNEMNIVNTAVPFLTIAPDSRSGAMGDIGVATSPDVNSLKWNAAKYAFVDQNMGASLSYTPWLRSLVNDINLLYLTGYKKVDNQQTLAASLLYFSLGEITFTREDGTVIRPGTPNEFAIDAAYSRRFSSRTSGGIAFRYIYSDLSGGAPTSNETSPGNAFAVDAGFFYTNDDLNLSGNDATVNAGINISNIGTKLSYSINNENFIPTNLGIGTSVKTQLDNYNSMTFAVDFNKLLVPTPQLDDSIGLGDPDASVPVAMLRSFYDAPGIYENGERKVWKEELREVTAGLGIEYWYVDQFAARAGYFYEHETKGNRKYFSVGLGLKLNVFALDISYLIPQAQNNPLANTVRFSLLFNFEAAREQDQQN